MEIPETELPDTLLLSVCSVAAWRSYAIDPPSVKDHSQYQVHFSHLF